MDANIVQINARPAKFNKDGEIVHDEYATLTLNIPMDSLTQKKEVMALYDFLNDGDVRVEITHPKGLSDLG